jgi:hypothetical protein
MGTAEVLFVVFLVLKLIDAIDWDWIWVFSPLLIGILWYLFCVLIAKLASPSEWREK